MWSSIGRMAIECNIVLHFEHRDVDINIMIYIYIHIVSAANIEDIDSVTKLFLQDLLMA